MRSPAAARPDRRSVGALVERTVGAAGPHLDAIAGEGTTQHIAALLHALPPSISRFYGFEVRADAHGADLLLQLQPAETLESGLTLLLAGGDRHVEQALRTLLEGATGGDDHEFACDDVWVEYDLDGEPRRTLPPPSLFCAPRLDGPSGGPALQRLLGGDEDSIELALQLERRAWPRAVVFQRGGMLARQRSPVRLCFTGERLGPWLAELADARRDAAAWGRVASRATQLLDQLGSEGPDPVGLDPVGVDIVDLDLVDGALAPVVGIEVAAHDQAALPRTADLLAAQSLASRRWLAAVRSWHGDVVATSSRLANRLAVDRPAAVPGKVVEHGVRRRVNHFKVTFRDGQAPAVKAYLGLGLGVRLTP